VSGSLRRILAVALLSIVVLVACQSDPMGGERFPPRDATVSAFGGSIRDATLDDVKLSWHEGCPVHWHDLSVVRVSYWGYDGERHLGSLVVHDWAATQVRDVFDSLYRYRFQIRRIHLIDYYGASDDRSMAANNTSAFNCRRVAGSTSWSMHSYGTAVDVNPMQNPYVNGTTYAPTGSEQWKDRSDVVPGMAVEGGPLVGAFDYVGWKWGGRWQTKKDYQHFSINGQ
jgi:hypothetical protein